MADLPLLATVSDRLAIILNKKCFHILYFQILVKFLFHVVEMTANRVNMVTRSSFVNIGSRSEDVFLLKLFGCLLTWLTHLLKSGLLWYQ